MRRLEGHRASETRRGQTSPTAALVAVALLGLGVSLYATVLSGAAPKPTREPATPTLERVHDHIAPAGVASPDRFGEAVTAVGPPGYAVNASLFAGGEQWSVGPVPPRQSPGVTDATRRTAVRTNRTTVRTGTLRVAVWR